MKILTSVFLAMLCIVATSYSQVIVDDVDINELEHVEYCLLLARSTTLFSKKVMVTVDYGQLLKEGTVIKDRYGKTIIFNSPIDAMNFMASNGWKFVDTYAITIGQSHVYHYLFKKDKDFDKSQVKDYKQIHTGRCEVQDVPGEYCGNPLCETIGGAKTCCEHVR